MRFRVNSTRSNVVIGIALVPAIALLCVAFGMFEQGRAGLGAAAAAGFVAILAPAGLVAKRMSRELEVTPEAMRERLRDGRVIEIRWDEPHALTHDTVVARRYGVPVTGTIRFALTAGDRAIRFSTPARRGMVGLAARMPAARDLGAGADAVEQAAAWSAVAQPRGARSA